MENKIDYIVKVYKDYISFQKHLNQWTSIGFNIIIKQCQYNFESGKLFVVVKRERRIVKWLSLKDSYRSLKK